MKRKLLFRRCLAMLLLLAVSALSWAYDFEVDGIHYLKNDDGTSVTVTYKPNDNDYSGSVTIPASVTYEDVTYSVTGIGYDAFSRCSGLTSISIPNSVTYISPNAFENCSGLTSITIPESVTEIDGSAFSGCSGLTSITIPESVTGIGSCVFRDCSALTSIIVASGNTVYDSRGGCNAVIEIASNTLIAGCKNTVIPDGVTGIAYGAFSGCSGLTSITIPESVTYISSNAFENCSCLESISVDANNKSFDSRNNCNAIIKTGTKSLIIGCKNTIIPESVTSIGDAAFYGCSGLISITIPNSVTTIGDAAFRGCTSLPVIDNVRYADTYLVGAVDKTLSSYTIKEGTRFIGGGAFGSCSKLTSIDIPESVRGIGSNAFSLCDNLTSIIIPESVTSIGNYAFTGCSKLASVTIESNAILSKSYGIAKGMRDIFGEQVREYIIGDGVTSIGESAFENCSGLTSVKIPESVTSIGNYAFYGCTSLPVENNLRYADTYLITAVGEAQSTYNIKEGTRFIGNNAFNVKNCSVITSITIPNSVIMIGDYAFHGCTGLPVIDNLRYADTYLVGTVDKTLSGYTIKEGTRFIGSAAFSGCSGLTSVTIPNSVTSIGESAFYNCSGLTSVVIGNSVTSIGEFAFENCSGLTSVTCLVTKSDRSTEDIVAPVEPTQPVMPEPGIDPSEITERLYPFNPAHNTDDDPPTTANVDETTEVTTGNVYSEEECKALWLEYYKKVYNTRFATIRRNNKVNQLLSNPYIIRGNEAVTLNQYRNEWNQYIVALNYFEYGYARILAGYNCLKDLGYYPMPSIEVSAFNEIPLDATLYVYENVMDAYKVISPWNKFGTILPIDPSDVREMKSSDANNDENALIYDLNGRRLTEKPKSGLYIQGGRKYLVK